ncbi:MAG: hypothetical protein GTN82_15600 [Candidatus Aminicenantes bacterium]|nr:hypothetical protein [Candidatus Aminicenantes bacterium]
MWAITDTVIRSEGPEYGNLIALCPFCYAEVTIDVWWFKTESRCQCSALLHDNFHGSAIAKKIFSTEEYQEFKKSMKGKHPLLRRFYSFQQTAGRKI